MRSTSRLSCSSWGWSSWPSTSSFTSATTSPRRPWQPTPRRLSRAYPLLLIHRPTHLLSGYQRTSRLLTSRLLTSHLLSSHLLTNRHLTSRHLTSRLLSSPRLSSPLRTSPLLTSRLLRSHLRTSHLLTRCLLSSPRLNRLLKALLPINTIRSLLDHRARPWGTLQGFLTRNVHIYPASQRVALTSMHRTGGRASSLVRRARTVQDSESGLPRIHLPRNSVNKCTGDVAGAPHPDYTQLQRLLLTQAITHRP